MMREGNIILTGQSIEKVVKDTVDSITRYLAVKEQERTERARIRACLQAITEKYRNDRIKFERYMERSFKEREKLYNVVDRYLQIAVKNNDYEMSKELLDTILMIYNKNPMMGLQEDNIRLDLISS